MYNPQLETFLRAADAGSFNKAVEAAYITPAAVIKQINLLEVQDLYGENLMLMHRNWSHYVDQLRDDIWQNHSRIHIVDFDFYNVEVFNRCENSNDILMAVQAWDRVHPLLRVIPVEWDHSIPCGLLHSRAPSGAVGHFLDAIWTVLRHRDCLNCYILFLIIT